MPVTREQQARTVTSTARRTQIAEATIEVIAEVGYGQTTFSRIAERARLSSTRLISYHFADKEELMGAVVAEVLATMSQHMSKRVGAARSASDKLRAYIEGLAEFTSGHRTAMKALLAIFLSGTLPYAAVEDHGRVGHVEAILREGQATGEFRDFDPMVVGAVVQRAVEGLPFLLESHPDLDCAAYARELVELFELGTRRSA